MGATVPLLLEVLGSGERMPRLVIAPLYPFLTRTDVDVFFTPSEGDQQRYPFLLQIPHDAA